MTTAKSPHFFYMTNILDFPHIGPCVNLGQVQQGTCLKAVYARDARSVYAYLRYYSIGHYINVCSGYITCWHLGNVPDPKKVQFVRQITLGVNHSRSELISKVYTTIASILININIKCTWKICIFKQIIYSWWPVLLQHRLKVYRYYYSGGSSFFRGGSRNPKIGCFSRVGALRSQKWGAISWRGGGQGPLAPAPKSAPVLGYIAFPWLTILCEFIEQGALGSICLMQMFV